MARPGNERVDNKALYFKGGGGANARKNGSSQTFSNIIHKCI